MAKLKVVFFLVLFVTFCLVIESFIVDSVNVHKDIIQNTHLKLHTKKIYTVEVDKLLVEESGAFSAPFDSASNNEEEIHRRHRRQVGVDTSNFAHQVYLSFYYC